MNLTLPFAMILSLTAAACVSVGTDFSWSAVSRLHVGEPLHEVVSDLGKPNAERSDAAGNRVLVWSHATGNMLGGAQSKFVALKFDKADRLVEVPKIPTVIR